MEKLYQLLNAIVAFKKARLQTVLEFEDFGKRGLLRTYGNCPSFPTYLAAENEMFRQIEEMALTYFDVDGIDKLSLQMALAKSEMQVRDVIAYLEEKELEEDFKEWLHEHDLEKSS